jgi:hypothetical protein
MPVTVCMYFDLRRTVLGSANDPNDCASMSHAAGALAMGFMTARGGEECVCPFIWLSAYASFLV